MAHGLLPNQRSGYSSRMAPMAGHVYITPDFHVAMFHTIGDVEGAPDNFEREPHGYLFMIKGSELTDVRADEDSIENFYRLHSSMQDGEMVFRPFRGDPHMQTVWEEINRLLTPEQRHTMWTSNDFADYAEIAKDVAPRMSEEAHLAIVENGGHVAHRGPVMPYECWRFPWQAFGRLKWMGPDVVLPYGQKIWSR